MIHVVFQEADIEVLQKAMALDSSLHGKIEIIRDDYAVGPLQNIYETEGYQQRREWWKSLLEQSPYNTDQLMDMVDDRMVVHNLKKSLDEKNKEVIWIWMGQNTHDVCGYYWLMTQLKEYRGSVFVLFMNNLPFINEKGQLFYPTTLHQIPPKEYLKAKKLSRAITASEFEVDPDEWKSLCNQNDFIRVLEGGKKITGRTEDFFDNDIISSLTNEWQKGNKAINAILSKLKVKTGDVFLLWRMKKLEGEGIIEINGDTAKGWKEFEVKLKSLSTEEITVNTNQI